MKTEKEIKEIKNITQEQVLEDIKAISEGREEDIKLPLRVLKREQPKAYRNACCNARNKTEEYKVHHKAYRKTDKYKDYMKAYYQSKKYKDYKKAYMKALFELKKKHIKDFRELLSKIQLK